MHFELHQMHSQDRGLLGESVFVGLADDHGRRVGDAVADGYMCAPLADERARAKPGDRHSGAANGSRSYGGAVATAP